MDSLRERFAHALARTGESPAAVAKKIGVTRQTLYNIENGTTKAEAIRAVTLYPLAEHFGVNPEWLLFGRGPRDLNDSGAVVGRENFSTPRSQFGRLDHAIITQARKWVLAEELIAGPYPRDELVDQVLAVYEMLLDSDGTVTDEQREARMAANRRRLGATGEANDISDDPPAGLSGSHPGQ